MVKRHLRVAAAILWQGKRFLAGRRPEGKHFAGLWEFPGGKIEEGEDARAALRRELREELDIEVGELSFVTLLSHEYHSGCVELHVFESSAWNGEIKALAASALAWVLPEEALDLPFLAADIPLVKELAARQAAL